MPATQATAVNFISQELFNYVSMYSSTRFEFELGNKVMCTSFTFIVGNNCFICYLNLLTAQDAIQLCSGPIMKLRPVCEGTTESKKKARYCSGRRL